ncbi:hypothetical protein Misp06_01065 [Microbulbifer sp. NBRC 101763]|uniref:hypothetical protein n=1 Tax=Microbulbifer sp. NBRC 101763 TaxID=1113820 RepID=UPI00309F1432
MKSYPSTFRAKLVAMAALLLLMFQVQTVLACEMMDSPEPAAECCCDHLAKGSQSDEDCCEYDTQVSLKTSLDDHEVALTAAFLHLELPQLAPPPSYRWPQILAPPAESPDFEPLSSHASPGNRTWLETLRLRI